MGNLTIFDLIYEDYKITKPIRLIEFFAGYGSQAFALKYLGVPFEHHRICEWSVPSIQAYKDAHFTNDNIDYSKCFTKEYIIEFLYHSGISMDYNKPMKLEQIKRMSEEQLRTIYNNILATNNLVNIQKVKGEQLDIVEQDKYTYMLTYSFPCQDLSLAGKGAGMSRDGGTRSGMLWEVERILEECNLLKCLPQILLMENVPQVIGQNNLKDFISWRGKLESLGYSNYVEILNAKDYGIPQNRQRCFMVSILGDYNYTFPKKIPLELKLKDMLENNVDEKYYLSDKMIAYCTGVNQKPSKFPRGERFKQSLDMANNKGIATTISTNAGNRPVDNFIIVKEKINKNLTETLRSNDLQDIDNVAYIDAYNRNIRKDDISCAITTRVNDSNNSYLLIKEATKKGYKEAYEGDGIDISGRMETHRGTVQKGMSQTIKTSIDVGVVVKENNLKTKLCNDLIVNGKVKENDVIRHSYSTSRMKEWENRNVEQNNMSPTLDTRCDCLGICVKDEYVGTYDYAQSDTLRPTEESRTHIGNDISGTILASGNHNGIINNNLRIRKLTPRECFRLMGVKDEDYENIAKNQSNSKLYHLAGDSIVVNVLMGIFKQIIK